MYAPLVTFWLKVIFCNIADVYSLTERALVNPPQIQHEFALIRGITGDDDRNTPVLLVQVACGVLGNIAVGGTVAGSGTGSNVQHRLLNFGVEHEGTAEPLGGTGTVQQEVFGGG